MFFVSSAVYSNTTYKPASLPLCWAQYGSPGYRNGHGSALWPRPERTWWATGAARWPRGQMITSLIDLRAKLSIADLLASFRSSLVTLENFTVIYFMSRKGSLSHHRGRGERDGETSQSDTGSSVRTERPSQRRSPGRPAGLGGSRSQHGGEQRSPGEVPSDSRIFWKLSGNDVSRESLTNVDNYHPTTYTLLCYFVICDLVDASQISQTPTWKGCVT